MYIILSILYGIVGIYIFRKLILTNRQNGLIGAYSGIIFGMLVYYIAVPILTMLNINVLGERYIKIKQYISDKSFLDYIYVLFLVVASFTFFEIGYKVNLKRKIKDEKTEKHSILKSELWHKILKITAWGTFVVGSICLFIFFNGIGGVVEAIKYGNTARAFYTSLENKIPNYIAILIIPARLVTVAPFLFLWLDSLNDKNRRHSKGKYLNKIFAAISFTFALLFFLYNAGKAPLICFLLSFFVAVGYKFSKKVWMILIPLAVVMLPMLDVLDELFAFFQNGEWKNIQIDYINCLSQFIYPFRTLINLPQINAEYGVRCGKDFVTAFLNFIPGFQFPVSYENISLFFGGEKWRITGGVPSDLITFIYTQFSLIGIPFLFMALGAVLRIIDGKLKMLPNKYATRLIQAIITIQLFSLVASADFEAVLRGQVILIILSVLLILMKGRATNEERGEENEDIICDINTTRI